MKRRRLIIQLLLIVAVFGFSAFLFVIGKGHQILIDNKRVSIDGQTLSAYEWVNVYVDGVKKPVEVEEGDRGLAKVAGPWHKIRVEILENGKIVKSYDRKFTVSLADSFILSVQLLVAEKDGWLIAR